LNWSRKNAIASGGIFSTASSTLRRSLIWTGAASSAGASAPQSRASVPFQRSASAPVGASSSADAADDSAGAAVSFSPSESSSSGELTSPVAGGGISIFSDGTGRFSAA